ncbi:hypothetical protein ACRRRS_20940 [Brucella anthropi]|uniref:hypothetical protein n=1 Tax=Brucella TaxID=234 RepID=UPI00124F1711|nr:hypothetical protein [Brucella anthropi]KAB2756840.1 hypothetical protein F9K81_13060 [Brucella anthropi]MBM6397293.1 hypothetical protein [Brucella anthropi]QFP64407.1 hypothetical protein FT787_14790 [Brucella anthropi]
MSSGSTASLIAIVLYASCTFGIAQPVFEQDGPFREAEGFGTPATCQTIDDWINRVPDYDGRITMVIKGAIEESHWDGALAYLVMCKPEGIQVMCVTYAEREASPKSVLFAGGYSRVGERQIVLDPCLVYPLD